MKAIILLAETFAFGNAVAAPVFDNEKNVGYVEEEIAPVTTTYLDNTCSGGGWGSNWFVSVQAGALAFVGSPTGHGDFFDRVKPVFNFAAGKWITPTVGGRLSL